MSVQVERLDHNMAKLTIEVPAADFDKAMNKAFNRQKKNIQVPGFRKGKVPFAMVLKMYGPEMFYEEAANDCIQSGYAAAFDEVDLEIVSRPEIDVTQIEKGKDFIFTALVAVKPEVTLGQYKGVEVTAFNAEVTAEEVDAQIAKEAEKNARTIEVTDRPVAMGDKIKLDFDGSVDGVPFEGGKAENYDLTIGSGAFIPGFEEQLVGAELGADVAVNVTFPEDYQAADLAGKAAVFACKVNAIEAKELPAIDDEFASEVSEFDTLEEYKADVQKKLVADKETAGKSNQTDEAIDAIVAASEMDVPAAMIDAEAEAMYNDFAQRMQQQGLTMDQYFQFMNTSREQLIEEAAPQAEKRIKANLVLEAIVKAEGIEVTEEEFDAELAKMGEAYGLEVEKVREFMGEAEKTSMKKDLAVQKAVDFVAANMVAVEK